MNTFVLTLHIIVASFWVGGMLFMVLALSPFVRKLPEAEKIQAYQEVGRKFSFWGTIIGLPLLFITGLLNMKYMGISLSDLSNWDNPYIATLHHKLHLFGITAVLAVIHDFYLGPRSHLSKKYSISARVIGVINLIIAIAIVFLAAKLRMGG